MDLTEATDYARELTLLKNYWTNEAVVKVGEIIADLCRTTNEARWLTNEMLREYNDWPGPKALKDTYDAKYRKPEENVFKGWEPVVRECDICEDNGVICENATYRRCQCDCGQKVDAKYLDYLNGQTVSAKNARGESSALKPITAADFATLGVKTPPVASVAHGGPSEKEKACRI